ncbi:MAG: PAS domain S-box protein, partial [archaeon]|nr:PAS domain S-box protein [archaeon]
ADTFVKLKLIDPDYSLEEFIYNPFPIKDYAWLLRVLVIAISVSVFLGVVTLFQIHFNKKLKSEVLERKRIEERLRQSEEKFRTIFKTSPNAITLSKVKDGNIVEVNDAFTKLLGYSKKDVIGHSSILLNIWNDLKARDLLVAGIKNNGLVENFEAEFKDKTGRIINGLMSARMLDIENRKYLLSVTQDITERQQAEQEKIKAQKIITDHKKLALVGQVAGKMAHDFNNILSIIMGNTELSLIKCKDDEIKKILELIFKQTLRGKNLTKNLVAFAKDQEPKQKFFMINEKINLVLNLMKKDLNGIELLMEESSGIPDLLADPGMIEHALVNLIQNSIHATSMVKKAKITIRSFHKKKNIYIEIEDNGCGIPEEVLDRIYEPAFTMKGSMDVTGSYKTDIKGTGYGMTNVKKYIEQHKGSITINSKVGNGTKITINLPVIKKELSKKEKIEIQKEIFYFEKYILLVEDEQAISDVQYQILTHEPCNHKVDVASNGQMAADLFDRNKYDFISLDYILPGKFNGMDVYKHIRQTNDTLPILFVSGNLDFLKSIKILKNSDPYVDHISKPCQNKDYVNAINELLEKILA